MSEYLFWPISVRVMKNWKFGKGKIDAIRVHKGRLRLAWDFRVGPVLISVGAKS